MESGVVPVQENSIESGALNAAAMLPGQLPSGFRLLWCGQSISLIGSQFSSLAIQVIAVNMLHAGAMQMGYLTASQTIPYLVFSLFIGVIIDRSSKRGLMVGADVIRCLTLVSAAILVGTGHLTITLLCGVVCFVSTFNLLFDAALGALIPQLFHLRQRLTANSRLQISLSGSEMVGPSVAGCVLEILSATSIMFVDAGTYLLSAGCILFAVRGQLTPTESSGPVAAKTVTPSGMVAAFVEGIKFVALQPILRAFGIWSATWNFSWSAVLAVLVLYASRTLNMSPFSIGLAFAIGALGGVAGAFIASELQRRWTYGRVLVVAPLVGACGGAVLLYAHGKHSFAIVAGGLFLYNLGETVFGVNMQTCRQNVTPYHLLGRMDTALRFCFKGMASLGALTGGYIGSTFGVYQALAVGVGGLFVAFLGLRFSRIADL